jgi:5-methylcytosine-specific restriction endonuclease McrA
MPGPNREFLERASQVEDVSDPFISQVDIVGGFPFINPNCRGCGNPATSLDHLMPYSRGGENAPRNLVACCTNCNSKKHARTPEEAGMELIELTDG